VNGSLVLFIESFCKYASFHKPDNVEEKRRIVMTTAPSIRIMSRVSFLSSVLKDRLWSANKKPRIAAIAPPHKREKRR
jgi:hypothetical protein